MCILFSYMNINVTKYIKLFCMELSRSKCKTMHNLYTFFIKFLLFLICFFFGFYFLLIILFEIILYIFFLVLLTFNYRCNTLHTFEVSLYFYNSLFFSGLPNVSLILLQKSESILKSVSYVLVCLSMFILHNITKHNQT